MDGTTRYCGTGLQVQKADEVQDGERDEDATYAKQDGARDGDGDATNARQDDGRGDDQDDLDSRHDIQARLRKAHLGQPTTTHQVCYRQVPGRDQDDEQETREKARALKRGRGSLPDVIITA